MADSISKVKAAELSRITGVSRSTHASWVERKVIEGPEGRAYEERHVVEAAIFDKLVAKVESGLAGAAWLDAGDAILELALKGAPDQEKRLDLVVNAQTGALDLVSDDDEIGRVALRGSGEPHVVIPLAQAIYGARTGYWRYARLAAVGKRRRPRGRRARRAKSA